MYLKKNFSCNSARGSRSKKILEELMENLCRDSL